MRKTKKQQWIGENGPGILKLLTTKQLWAALAECSPPEDPLYQLAQEKLAKYEVIEQVA